MISLDYFPNSKREYGGFCLTKDYTRNRLQM
jgi:hypothetical protein